MDTFTKVIRNSIYNAAGQGLPLLAALVAIPILTRSLGVPRFGVLTIAWMLIGYFSLFDFGLGRAITALVAERDAGDRRHEIPAMVWTSLALMAGFGIVATSLLLLTSHWLAFSLLNVPPELRTETAAAFKVIAYCMPIVVTTTGLVGTLSAYSRFDVINLIRVPLGLLSYLAPLLVLPYTHSLVFVTVTLVVSRVIAFIAYFVACNRAVPLLADIRFRPEAVRPLLAFGGWMTVSNLISPIMVNFDRFLIGALISVAAVAFYTTPYEAVNKLWVIGGSLGAALFPEFAREFRRDKANCASLLSSAIDSALVALIPLVVVVVLWAREGLQLWLGAQFSANSTIVLRLLAVGVLANCVAAIPFAFIQGIGRPDITAKLHLIELPAYVVLVIALTHYFGICGTATAWVIRVSLDLLALLGISSRLLSRPMYLGRLVAIAVAALGLVALCVASPFMVRAAVSFVVVGMSAALLRRQIAQRKLFLFKQVHVQQD
jgi:O-antigen/teichoic acid export membrane protein